MQKDRLYQKFIFENVGKIEGYTVSFRLKNGKEVLIEIGCQTYKSIAEVKKAAAAAIDGMKNHDYVVGNSKAQIAAEKKAYDKTIAKMVRLEKLFKKIAKQAMKK